MPYIGFVCKVKVLKIQKLRSKKKMYYTNITQL